MKNRFIVSIATIILGILVVLIPHVIFPVCESMEMKMSCYYSEQAVTGVGILITLLGIAALFIGNENVRLGISVAQVLNAILVLALPLKLTGLCKMESMDCRKATLPAWIVVSVLLIIINVINIVWSVIKSRENGSAEK